MRLPSRGVRRACVRGVSRGTCPLSFPVQRQQVSGFCVGVLCVAPRVSEDSSTAGSICPRLPGWVPLLILAEPGCW